MTDSTVHAHHDHHAPAGEQHGAHGGHDEHGGHDKHAGHDPEMFPAPTSSISPSRWSSPARWSWTGSATPSTSWGWTCWGRCSDRSCSGGVDGCLAGGAAEVRDRQPGMMLLISMAITVAYVASMATSLDWFDLDFWWRLPPS